MAEPSPWQAIADKKLKYRRTVITARDVYNFSSTSVSSGTNPVVLIPCVGPHAAGAVQASSAPQVVAVVLTPVNAAPPVTPGSNFHAPST